MASLNSDVKPPSISISTSIFTSETSQISSLSVVSSASHPKVAIVETTCNLVTTSEEPQSQDGRWTPGLQPMGTFRKPYLPRFTQVLHSVRQCRDIGTNESGYLDMQSILGLHWYNIHQYSIYMQLQSGIYTVTVSGWWFQSLWKMWVRQIGSSSQLLGKIIHSCSSHHQPGIFQYIPSGKLT